MSDIEGREAVILIVKITIITYKKILLDAVHEEIILREVTQLRSTHVNSLAYIRGMNLAAAPMRAACLQ
ncbi:hypothetical protein PAECIP111893_01258 [Paenibacillus plantiphilus]|uniref:Tn3 transposase DDE domain-containing protein n=1 Tax=Paenibacillus plantiphilus TaxID=2905650 RepID=A0ABN8G3Q8_9BACL|nr:hypothetical protein PAECIP111893_01258 [Paenibacillus plantiphilus]